VEKRDQEIIERIMKYLQEKPEAGDTLEGISQFWLEFERVDHSVDEVSNALESLVRQGAVTKVESMGGLPIYKLTRMA
jgi:Fe2+ or Zn2+ uptake regulation protein